MYDTYTQRAAVRNNIKEEDVTEEMREKEKKIALGEIYGLKLTDSDIEDLNKEEKELKNTVKNYFQ